MTDERSASDATVDSTQASARAGFGARLASEREQRALSQADVARALNLRVAVIVAIEEEHFAALPQMAFVRGYARTYARLLDFPEAEIADALASWRDPGEDGRLPLSPGSVAPKRGLSRGLHDHAGLILTLLSILVAVLLAAALMMIWPEGGFTSTDSASAVESQTPAPATRALPAAVPGLQVDGRDMSTAPEVEAGSDSEGDLLADDGYDGSEGAEGGSVGAAGFAVRRESADDGQLLRVFAEGEDFVWLRFSGDCWVEIRDAEGRGVVSDLAREGQTFEIYGQGPFRLLLGYAHGVQLAYNGEQVALAPHIRNDIASLVVGR